MAGFKMQGVALFFPVGKVDLVTGGVVWMVEKCMQTGSWILHIHEVTNFFDRQLGVLNSLFSFSPFLFHVNVMIN